mmetsp:Transcript_76/g.129  ORF Transcript_76/g.129 Transcript_76/m.129 type:complete len:381 (-) Transcript_76:205-1347(-)|eukprot:CAMPEP_0184694448 /NCGR_PEP_ID=MMETSP0313-20130426/2406_1 /TAXON_ID=2792 /ORGANISM="Porphyridium aerugineum, Strain SAG 1380-2" /LENGTH=380 /DNA_ID=CAMNT_0027152743 /DNA_START=142 /DNA_END=1284 /DNA_ORIENTATION=-
MSAHWSPYASELVATAHALVAPGKGILAADESTGTIGKRFKGINVENNEENRRLYRELLFTAPGMEEHISGVIMFEETLYHKCGVGGSGTQSFVDLLKSKGVIPGIKVDKGVTPIPGTREETSTQGLDGLLQRCEKYYKDGARFAKWRAVLKVDVAAETKGENKAYVTLPCPSDTAIKENAWGLARYAAICQHAGLVPIVEPEILMDGTHTIQQAAEITTRVLTEVYKALHENHVLLEGTLLKPNMVQAGYDLPNVKELNTPANVASYTLETLMRTVPVSVPGIVFLSGGQSEEEASLNLNALNVLAKQAKTKIPWNMSFSYGRALQASCLKAWEGKPEKMDAGKQEFLKRSKANGLATLGQYQGGTGGTESLFVKSYVY